MRFRSAEPSDESSVGEEKTNTPHMNEPVSSTVKEDGSYEIIFGAGKNDPTAYSANGFNAYGFSANGSPNRSETPQPAKKSRPKKKKQPIHPMTVSTVILLIALAMLTLSVALFVTALVTMESEGTQSIGTKPTETGSREPWVNPAVLDASDAYANATAHVIDAVVTITAGSSSGSGVIWSTGEETSYILTCNHVIDNADEIEITLYDGTSYHAEVVGTDSRTDIAILRVSANDLTPIVLPNEDYSLALGQAVIAIGNPLGTLSHSVSNGILSSLKRTVTVEGTTMELIQTNAAVNHGNSGGGLFDINGQLIGLVNAKVSEATVEGIGFAIPYSTLKTIAAELIEKGYVSGRPALGISAVTLSADNYTAVLEQYPDLEAYATTRNFFGQKQIVLGVYVLETKESIQYAEGSETLVFGDRLMAIGTTTVSDDADVTSALNGYAVGDTVKLTVSRRNNQNPLIIEIILGEVSS